MIQNNWKIAHKQYFSSNNRFFNKTWFTVRRLSCFLFRIKRQKIADRREEVKRSLDDIIILRQEIIPISFPRKWGIKWKVLISIIRKSEGDSTHPISSPLNHCLKRFLLWPLNYVIGNGWSNPHEQYLFRYIVVETHPGQEAQHRIERRKNSAIKIRFSVVVAHNLNFKFIACGIPITWILE